MSSTVRVGIVGTGFMGRVHANAVLVNGGTVVGVVGRTEQSAVSAVDGLPGARAMNSLDDLLDANVDVVHICTPNHLHADQARAVADSGVAVICEKPLASTLEDARGVAALVRDRPAVAAVPFVYRYHGAVREIRAELRRGSTSTPWLVHGSYLQDWLSAPAAMNWRVDPALGGSSRAFGDIGVHWVDLMEHVTGQRITHLSAVFGNAFERDGGPAANRTEDGAVVSFRTDAGSIGSVVVSQASAGRKNRLWFSFDAADRSFSFDQEQPDSYWLGTRESVQVVNRDPARLSLSGSAQRRALPAGHPQGYQHCFDDFVGDVFEAIRTGSYTGYPTFDDGLRAAEVTAAVTSSNAAGGAWTPVTGDATQLLYEERTGTAA